MALDICEGFTLLTGAVDVNCRWRLSGVSPSNGLSFENSSTACAWVNTWEGGDDTPVAVPTAPDPGLG